MSLWSQSPRHVAQMYGVELREKEEDEVITHDAHPEQLCVRRLIHWSFCVTLSVFRAVVRLFASLWTQQWKFSEAFSVEMTLRSRTG